MVHSAFYRGLEQAQRHLPGAAAGRTAPALADRAARAGALLQQWIAAPAEPLACRAGCAHCCRHPVGITFGEALLLAQAVQALPPVERAATIADTIAAAATTAAEPWSHLARRDCPLLDTGRCRVYAARPIACRAFGSTDRQACERAADDPAVAIPFDRQAFGLGLGIGHALAAGGGHRELRSALAAMLALPAAAGAPGLEDAQRAFAAARPAGEDTDAPPPPAGAPRT